jgi:23S rRNA pseudouridine2605 synthase
MKRVDVPIRRVGLARALSKLGYCSRSQAAELIRAGRVRLNGAVRRDPESPTNPETDRIDVDNAQIGAAKRVYIMLNKPRGLVTTTSDEKARDTVYSCLTDAALPWVAAVGRLDKASEGLLLLTNDSEWAARITAPESHVSKTYHVQVGVVADEALCRRMQRGVRVDGEMLRAKSASIIRTGEKNSWIEVVLDEGRNRQIRRLLDALGVETLRLVRVAIGPLRLGNLAKGKWRELSRDEVSALNQH